MLVKILSRPFLLWKSGTSTRNPRDAYQHTGQPFPLPSLIGLQLKARQLGNALFSPPPLPLAIRLLISKQEMHIASGRGERVHFFLCVLHLEQFDGPTWNTDVALASPVVKELTNCFALFYGF